MTLDTQHEILIDAIVDRLRQGLHLTSDVMHFIDSVFAEPSAKDLRKHLEAASDCEAESVLELIFSPDEAFQVCMEDILERFEYRRADEKAIQAGLGSRRPKAVLHLPDGRGVLTMMLPARMAASIVERLHICVQLDAEVVRAIDTFVDASLRRPYKVKLRHARVIFSEKTVSFLCRCFEKLPADRPDAFDRFAFLLDFLRDIPDQADLYSALSAGKRFYIKNLQRAEAAADQARGKAMETLMQQGVRTPYLDKDRARKKIRWLDEISLAVFEKTDYVGPLEDSISVGISRQGDDDSKFFKVLF